MSLHAAQLVHNELRGRTGVNTELIDIAKMPLPVNDAGEAIKNPGYAEKMNRADALVLIFAGI